MLDKLPNECVELVLAHVAAAGDVTTIVHVSKTCRRLRQLVADLDRLWTRLHDRLYGPEADVEVADWLASEQAPLPPLPDLSPRERVIRQRVISNDVQRCLQRMEQSRANMPLAMARISTHHGALAIHELKATMAREPRTGHLTRKFFAARALERVRSRLLSRRWADLLRNADARPLEEGALLIDQYVHSWDAAPRQTRAALDRFAAHAQAAIARARTSNGQELTLRQQLDCVVQVLFQDHQDHDGGAAAFRGDADDYYNSDNSFLCRVIERRLGIPISLSILFAAVAHRVGLTAVQLTNFPGHVVSIVDSAHHNPPLVIDAFRRGNISTPVEFVSLFFGDQPVLLDLLRPTQNVNVWERQLRNLVSGSSPDLRALNLMSYIHEGDLTMLMAWAHHMLTEHPEDADLVVLRFDEEFRSGAVPNFLVQTDILTRANHIRASFERDPVRRDRHHLHNHGGNISPAGPTFLIGQIVRTINSTGVVCDNANAPSSYGIISPSNHEPVVVMPRLLSAVESAEEINSVGERLLLENSFVGYYFESFRPGVGFVPNRVLQNAFPNRILLS